MKTVSCGTATIREGKNGYEVLLVKPCAKQDKWGFPKGHLDTNETQEDAAARETLEETGVSVTILPCILGTTKLKLKKENKTVVIYMAIPDDPNCVPFPVDGENAYVAWHPIDELPNIMQSQREIFSALRSTITRLF